MEKFSRRDFFKRAALAALSATPVASALSALSSCSVGERRMPSLTILHTNDVHSHIDPFPAEDPRYHNMGGYARRQALIDKVRTLNGGDNVFVFDCGDMFQGTPYFNFYKGALEIQLMNRMHIDAVTIGNHEFDNGVEALCDCIEIANFPFLNANYDISNQRMARLVQPYRIFERAGIRVGVFGLGIKLPGLVSSFNHEGVSSDKDIISVARETSALLRHEGCQMVIALSHIGYSMANQCDDISVAMATQDIDVILGGHTHTFLHQPDFITNAAGRKVLVNQVGFGGICVGQIEFVPQVDGSLVFSGANCNEMGPAFC